MSNITQEDVEKLLAKQAENFEARIQKAEQNHTDAASVDYNPKTKWTYKADPTRKPQFDNPIKNHEKWMHIYYPSTEADKAALAGSSDKDLEEDCYSSEWLGKYQELKALMNKGLFGSVITSNDFSVLRVEANVSRVLGFNLNQDILQGAVTTQATPNLVARYRTWSGFEIEPHVGEGVIVEAKKGNMTENTFSIKKDVGAAAITIEAELTTEGDVFGDHVSWIAQKMRQLRTTKIITALNTATTSTSGADWGVYTGDRSTNDPGETFLTVVNALNGQTNARYTLNTIVSHPQPKREYFQNTFVKGIFPAGPDVTSSPATFGTPGIEGNPTWYTSVNVTPATIAFAYDREVVVLFEGPKRQTEIGRPDAEVREYYSRDFNDVFIIDQGGIHKITGITA